MRVAGWRSHIALVGRCSVHARALPSVPRPSPLVVHYHTRAQTRVSFPVEAAADPTWRESVVARLDHMQHAIHTYRQIVTRGALLALGVGGWVVFFFGDELKTWWGRQGADVGRVVLSDEGLQNEAEALSKALAERVLTDPKMADLAVAFVREVLASLLRDPETLALAAQFLNEVTRRPDTQQAISDLLLFALAHERTQNFVSAYASNLIVSDAFTRSATSLGTTVAHNVLNNTAVKQHARVFVSEVMADKAVQKDSGDLLWSAFLHSITPRWPRLWSSGDK